MHAKKHIDAQRDHPGYRMRRERLGEWAVVLVMLLGAGLWCCWPTVVRPQKPARLPEPGAAYVETVASGGFLMHRPDRLAHGGLTESSPDEAFPLLAPAPWPALPAPPAYAEINHLPPSLPLNYVRRFEPQALTLSPPLKSLPVQPIRRVRMVRLSPELDQAQYSFTAPTNSMGTGGRIRYQVLLGYDGRVDALLDELPSDSSANLAWRQALLQGRGVTNATGFVEAEW